MSLTVSKVVGLLLISNKISKKRAESSLPVGANIPVRIHQPKSPEN
jgi:hypothetical protein